MRRYLICTDLDRTLIPNGAQPESAAARACFCALAARADVALAYVSGRHLVLVEQAVAEFSLPQPDFVIADVGATIYRSDVSGWQQWAAWDEQIAPDWQGLAHDELCHLLSGFAALRLQEKDKQNRHKLSYYIPIDTDVQGLIDGIAARLEQANIRSNLIWSIDEAASVGLLDVLPVSANKLHAIRFLMRQQGYCLEDAVFAGDSGNDLDVLLSDIPSVLVANADAKVRAAVAHADRCALYIAAGGFLGMNGNYSAGILEGVAHFLPEVGAWLREQRRIK